MSTFRLLKADEIECRIAMVKPTFITLLLYKTARTDANLLDETVGEDMWENDFKIVDGVLYGGIGIRRRDELGKATDTVVWKWDAGTESNTEAEKGRASDAFKRAGFKWGIGRELYTAPFIKIPQGKAEIKDGKCYDKFEVSAISYNDKREITELVIKNVTTGAEVFRMGADTSQEKITKKEAANLEAVAKSKNIPVENVPKFYHKSKLEELTSAEYADALRSLNG